MKIIEAIEKIKNYHKGVFEGKKIDDKTTRDKILYGDANQECTGIVTTCWASVDVIRKAHAQGANLIICHEALFWNHGDHTDWLIESENTTFLAKKKLLDETGIVVWRDHDYIHSGIPKGDGSYIDGIFYGLSEKLGWSDYIIEDKENPLFFDLPETTAKDLAEDIINKLNLNGIKILGDTSTKVKKVKIPFHVLGDARDSIEEANKKDIDCFLTLELVDFTLAEYIRDSSMLNMNKVAINMGHFNLEEPGMEYMIHYLPDALNEDIPCIYIQSGDMYSYVTKD
jgi:putative NIF3 family GTP cyclohydrolase 1 type 2